MSCYKMRAMKVLASFIILTTPTMVKTANPCITTENKQDNVIAFTLGQDKHFQDTLGSIMGFNKVIHSMGLSSDFQTSGVFTCPTKGVYKFQVSSLTAEDKRLWLELYRNEELVASLYGYNPKYYASAANAVLLFLKKNDKIYVKTRSEYDVMMFGLPDQIYTTFSGTQMSNFTVAEGFTFRGTRQSDTLKGNTYDVSFSASLTTHKVFETGSTILYDKVLLDHGNGYNTNTGTFTAPVSGIYLFHFFSLSKKDNIIWQELYHNSDYVCALYGYTPNEYAAAGNTAILNLRLGDEVQVKAKQTNHLYGTNDEAYSIFSGALISELPNVSLSSWMIAFSVGLTTSSVVPANSKVIFDQIFLNVKRAYDPRAGEFIAPTDGTYEFNVHAMGQKGEMVWLELFHNYKYLVSLYSHVPEGYGSTSNSAVVRLYADDVVYVKTRYNKQSALYGGPYEIYCTFSGRIITTS